MLTLLLDLDDTLLTNKMDVFIPAYLNALSGHLDKFSEPKKLISHLLNATRLMVENQLPNRTLKEVFDTAFYPSLSVQYEQINPSIEQFYLEIFPHLQKLTKPADGAKIMVEEALRRGYQVVIATNPLFPRTAILQRLTWAGFSPDKYSFSLVPSYETFHFAKPNPTYFTEILAQIGWPDGPVLMVGDDEQMDIQPASRIGIATFQVVNPPQSTETNATGSGSLSSLISWLDQTPLETLQPDLKSSASMLATLHATPAALHNLSLKLDDIQWKIFPQPGEWDLTEILCHLRDVEAEVNLPRIQLLLQENNPFIPGKDTDPWAEERHYITQAGDAALRSFSAARQTLLAMLVELQDNDWNRPARHAIFGPTTLKEMVGIIAGHDRLHVQQIYKLIYIISHK